MPARGMKYVSDSFLTEPARFWEISPKTWRPVVDTNVNGPFFMARCAAPADDPSALGKDHPHLAESGDHASSWILALWSVYGGIGIGDDQLVARTGRQSGHGKASHIRTIPVPDWVKHLIDDWLCSAGISSGRVFRRVTRAGTIWGSGLSEKVVWHVARQYARKAGMEKLAPP